MFNTIGLCYRCFKTVIYIRELANGDESKIEDVKKIIEENFDL